ncbi:Chloroplast sensor kinase, chloroplastic [Linum perenne]
MILLAAVPLHTPLSISNFNSTSTAVTASNLLPCSANYQKLPPTAPAVLLSSSFSSTSSTAPASKKLRHVSQSPSPENADDEAEAEMDPSASAIVAAIQRGGSNTASVEFEQRIVKDQKSKLMLPSPDFHRLCVEQLDLFRRIVHPEAVLSVYVRPAGSYVMDQLELRRVVASHPGAESDEVLVLTGNFRIATGLRAAEAALTRRQIEFVSEPSAVVFPMVKHPFVVGFLVAELPKMEMDASDQVQDDRCSDLMHLPPSLEDSYASSLGFDERVLGNENHDDQLHSSIHRLSSDNRLNAINISRSLAMAYVMDQKAMLLQHSSWQTNVRMSSLVEQIPYDVVEDILVQGEHIRDTLQELQDAVYMTKANIMRYNEESLKRIGSSTNIAPERESCQLPQNLLRDYSSKLRNSNEASPLSTNLDDLEMPMPPLSLSPLDTVGIRPCNVSEVLTDMVEAVKPLATMQQRSVELKDLSRPFQVAVEEPALRQGLSNLIEGALLRTQAGGKVDIVSTSAPAGGVLVVIDDDGPDMHYMTQMHSLTPFGADLFSEGMVEDNMTWNFIAGLTVAREILESYGCVVRVISPRSMDAAVGSGGTRIELWLPSLTETPN